MPMILNELTAGAKYYCETQNETRKGDVAPANAGTFTQYGILSNPHYVGIPPLAAP
jgi:hypothetical protein